MLLRHTAAGRVRQCRGRGRGAPAQRRQPAVSSNVSENKELQPLAGGLRQRCEAGGGFGLQALLGNVAAAKDGEAVARPAEDGLGDALDEALGEGRPSCVGGGADAMTTPRGVA